MLNVDYGVAMPASSRMSSTLVILLSGASSAGKTSLAKALQRRLLAPLVLVEADLMFPEIPSLHPRWSAAGRSHEDVVLAFHHSVASWAEAGFDVTVDGSLPYADRQLCDACVRVFDSFDTRLVGVRCSALTLVEREANRPDERPVGWAARQAKDIHDGMRYAAEIDTTAISPEACADEVAAQLQLAVWEPP